MTKPVLALLDGGMGRELKRMGAPFRQPEWSALALIEAPHFVQKAHQAFIAAGARIITTNSYAIVPFHIGEARFSAEAESLAKVAGQAARTAVERQLEDVCVAGSLPPALGSYRPDLFDYQRSIAIHRKLIAGLEPYVDVWLAETQSSIAEARAVHEALAGNSKPLWLSFTLLDDVLKGARLRSGETVYDAVTVGLALGAEAVLFNCSQPEVMGLALDEASRAVDASLSPPKLGVYANAFPVVDETAEANAILLDIRPDLGPAAYVSWARQWIGQGASIIGGCCGIGPEHIAELRNQLHSPRPSFD